MSTNCSSSACSSCASKGACPSQQAQSLQVQPHAKTHIQQVIAVMSGKGGVGKSFVTTELAVSLRRKGLKVGILDADITGPSILKAFGLNDVQARATHEGILPIESRSGIKLMSINALLDTPSDPVVWRGPVIAGVVKQFWTDVIWGDLDVLLVDMPPGTGDVPLTVFQSLPVHGAVVVTTPQDLVTHIVEKSIKMGQKLNIPILGLIENFAWFTCPSCESRHLLYGASHAKSLTEAYHIPNLVQLPLRPELPEMIDNGRAEMLELPELEAFVQAIRGAAHDC